MNEHDEIIVNAIKKALQLTGKDKIKFSRGGEDMFEQDITSMQVEHDSIEKAKKGDVIGLKVESELKEGMREADEKKVEEKKEE